jgi:hypothetical protein
VFEFCKKREKHRTKKYADYHREHSACFDPNDDGTPERTLDSESAEPGGLRVEEGNGDCDDNATEGCVFDYWFFLRIDAPRSNVVMTLDFALSENGNASEPSYSVTQSQLIRSPYREPEHPYFAFSGFQRPLLPNFTSVAGKRGVWGDLPATGNRKETTAAEKMREEFQGECTLLMIDKSAWLLVHASWLTCIDSSTLYYELLVRHWFFDTYDANYDRRRKREVLKTVLKWVYPSNLEAYKNIMPSDDELFDVYHEALFKIVNRFFSTEDSNSTSSSSTPAKSSADAEETGGVSDRRFRDSGEKKEDEASLEKKRREAAEMTSFETSVKWFYENMVDIGGEDRDCSSLVRSARDMILFNREHVVEMDAIKYIMKGFDAGNLDRREFPAAYAACKDMLFYRKYVGNAIADHGLKTAGLGDPRRCTAGFDSDDGDYDDDRYYDDYDRLRDSAAEKLREDLESFSSCCSSCCCSCSYCSSSVQSSETECDYDLPPEESGSLRRRSDSPGSKNDQNTRPDDFKENGDPGDKMRAKKKCQMSNCVITVKSAIPTSYMKEIVDTDETEDRLRSESPENEKTKKIGNDDEDDDDDDDTDNDNDGDESKASTKEKFSSIKVGSQYRKKHLCLVSLYMMCASPACPDSYARALFLGISAVTTVEVMKSRAMSKAMVFESSGTTIDNSDLRYAPDEFRSTPTQRVKSFRRWRGLRRSPKLYSQLQVIHPSAAKVSAKSLSSHPLGEPSNGGKPSEARKNSHVRTFEIKSANPLGCGVKKPYGFEVPAEERKTKSIYSNRIPRLLSEANRIPRLLSEANRIPRLAPEGPTPKSAQPTTATNARPKWTDVVPSCEYLWTDEHLYRKTYLHTGMPKGKKVEKRYGSLMTSTRIFFALIEKLAMVVYSGKPIDEVRKQIAEVSTPDVFKENSRYIASLLERNPNKNKLMEEIKDSVLLSRPFDGDPSDFGSQPRKRSGLPVGANAGDGKTNRTDRKSGSEIEPEKRRRRYRFVGDPKLIRSDDLVIVRKSEANERPALNSAYDWAFEEDWMGEIGMKTKKDGTAKFDATKVASLPKCKLPKRRPARPPADPIFSLGPEKPPTALAPTETPPAIATAESLSANLADKLSPVEFEFEFERPREVEVRRESSPAFSFESVFRRDYGKQEEPSTFREKHGGREESLVFRDEYENCEDPFDVSKDVFCDRTSLRGSPYVRPVPVREFSVPIGDIESRAGPGFRIPPLVHDRSIRPHPKKGDPIVAAFSNPFLQKSSILREGPTRLPSIPKTAIDMSSRKRRRQSAGLPVGNSFDFKTYVPPSPKRRKIESNIVPIVPIR